MPPLMAAEVVGESSEDDETLAYVGRLQPPGAAREAGVRRGEEELLLTIPEVAKRLEVRPSLRWSLSPFDQRLCRIPASCGLRKLGDSSRLEG